jgi:hypothetical protein
MDKPLLTDKMFNFLVTTYYVVACVATAVILIFFIIEDTERAREIEQERQIQAMEYQLRYNGQK